MGLRAGLNAVEERKIYLWIEPRFLGRPAHNLAAILTERSWQTISNGMTMIIIIIIHYFSACQQRVAYNRRAQNVHKIKLD
jgi:hypothetical protein